jgi:hypothetical protein
MAVLHPDEMVVQKDLADPLRQRGLDRNDVAMYAMRYHDEVLNNSAASHGSFSDIMTLSALNKISEGQDKIVEAIDRIDIPEYHQNWDAHQKAFVEVIKTNNEIKRYFTFIKK